MNRTDVIDRLKKSESVFKSAGVKHLYLFGSTARDEALPGSDVDLFFDHDYGALSLFDIMHIKELAADIIGTKTDMIPRRGLHRLIKERVEAAAIQVF